MKAAAPHTRSFDSAPRVRKEETVTFERFDDKNPSWFCGRDTNGVAGYFPTEWFSIAETRGSAVARRDYDGMELSLTVGDAIDQVGEIYGEWALVTSGNGRGWVPANCLPPDRRIESLKPPWPHAHPGTPDDRDTIAVSLVRRLIAAQFPKWSDLKITPVDRQGWDNRTFRLGDAMTVRLPSAERYAAQVAKEQKWLPELAPFLPFPIPVPLAMGEPTDGYPWRWSVYHWIDGECASIARISDESQFASSLGGFLSALQKVDTAGGPPPGPHNFFRGGHLSVYSTETEKASAALSGRIDGDAAMRVWEAALAAEWHGKPVWLHGDIAASNLLVKDGRLSAVIDFGSSAIGDPACDLTIAWTFLSGKSREAFRSILHLDEATWTRARGWALWKGLITLAGHAGSDPSIVKVALRTVEEVIAEHAERSQHGS